MTEAFICDAVRTPIGRYGGVLSLLMMDLDHFKAINDTYGHEIGNDVLRRTARFLKDTARETDAVARYGGEEFAIILPETNLADATTLAERIRAGLPRAVQIKAHPDLRVRCSLGVASFPGHAPDSAGLFRIADRALYAAKHGGRNQVRAG